MSFSTRLRYRASSLIRYNLSLPITTNVRVSKYPSGLSQFRLLCIAPSLSTRVGPVKGGGGSSAEEKIVPTEIHKEAHDSYMAYAMSVLLGRAIPDVRDGLKPVHRRILFAMHELGISSRNPHKKCARVVGEVLGKFHPHGDNAVYNALVRMAQDFSMRYPLIQGHGNFGSVDADPPAAMRYTECRLEALTEAMLLSDLEQNTVDFEPNFDNSLKEPSVLPAKLPVLLLNGSSGIAVGMATNIPPHNLGELVDALNVLINNPEVTLQELLEYMPGPDFPTGGIITSATGILKAYQTGRGCVIVRGKTDIEVVDSKTKRFAIIIKEVPYQTNKSTLVEKIAELMENKILEGVSDIRDESDRTGMRIVLELKKGSDPSIALENLYRLTALQSSFSCNMVSIIDGQPKLMGLKELLQAFLDFRCSVIERRAKFKLSQAQERKHIVEGIIVGLKNVDGVIDILSKSSSNIITSAALRNAYNLSETQADALLGLTLRRLTLNESKKYMDEARLLTEEICKLSELLSSKKLILKLIEQEATELKNKFSTPRRSMLEHTV
ncbi:DNA gyrase subunit A, chloroplastic/mitochondrial-like [Papaver somniferum]|uniref:DNA gyrase subunit A, chloroplastic/mitochondrial-like n=1 Tax=Papaver somniferum TaxID=3469 RepID=UPI000E6FCE7E|nr:DNA gyrase subunit A, chloroplastic/mitochondrial-like [Papaver somniferum]